MALRRFPSESPKSVTADIPFTSMSLVLQMTSLVGMVTVRRIHLRLMQFMPLVIQDGVAFVV